MEKLKSFVMTHFEKLLVLSLSIIIVLANFFVVQKFAFLNFYYLPVLVSGYLLGRRTAIMTGVFCLALTVFSAINNPALFLVEKSSMLLATDLMLWGGFLILAAYVVARFTNRRKRRFRS